MVLYLHLHWVHHPYNLSFYPLLQSSRHCVVQNFFLWSYYILLWATTRTLISPTVESQRACSPKPENLTWSLATGDSYIQPARIVIYKKGETVDILLNLPISVWPECGGANWTSLGPFHLWFGISTFTGFIILTICNFILYFSLPGIVWSRICFFGAITSFFGLLQGP